MKVFCVCILLLCLPALSHAATVELTWQDNSDNEEGFRVRQRTPPNGGFSLLTSVGANVQTATDTLAAGESRCYVVAAYNAAGPSANSNEACITAPAAVQIPTAPGSLGIKITIEVMTAPTEAPQGE